MRKTNLFAVACVLAVAASPLMARQADSAQACWQPAFEKGDADAVAKCYASDAVLWLQGAPVMKGRDAIRAGYADFFAASTIKSVKLTELGKVSDGNDAASWGTFSLVLVSRKDGKETTELGRYTDVSRRVGGHWQYVVDHASDDPAAAGG
jgi:uncharacterized protein (TIGR02246 family)